MKSRGVVGKRIASITQSRTFNENIGRMTVSIDRITLEDGTVLVPSVEEFPSDYGVDFLVIPPKNGGAT